jgi:tripartite-type tricarboxylate transporter receptor subunit TctC
MKTRIAKSLCMGLVLFACALGAVHAQGSDKISGPLRLVVGFPPGGTVDILARAMADSLSASLGVPVIVDNKPGAGGRIAAENLKNSAADGNSVMISPIGTVLIVPLVYKKLSFNPETDFVPTAQLGKFQLGIATSGTSPHKNLGDMVAWLKANPKQANFGTSAAGSLLHFLGLMFGQSIGVPMTHVPYQGGAPLVTDLIGGQVPLAVDQFPIDLHKSGKIRLLATSGATRSQFTPDVPTFQEQGVPGVAIEGWHGAFMHIKTPPAIVNRISQALSEAVRQPSVKEKLAIAGIEATGVQASEFARIMSSDRARWKPVIDASGFNPE